MNGNINIPDANENHSPVQESVRMEAASPQPSSPHIPTHGKAASKGRKGSIHKVWQRIKGLAVAMGVGMIIGGTMVGSVIASPVLREFFREEMAGNGLGIFMLYWIVGMAILVAVIYAQIIIHEGGHLVCGLATGYRFVSFRIGSLILYRDGGRMRLGRFSIAGTAGQCLLEPPTDNIADATSIPYRAYSLGGVAANTIVAIMAAVVLIAGVENVAVAFAAAMFFITGVVIAAMNGIPMRMAGVPNDGYTFRTMKQEADMRRSLWVQLTVNAQYSRGRLLRDMPDEWFAIPDGADLANHMYTTIAVFDVWRHVEHRDFEAADTLLRRLHACDGRMIELFRLETTADRMFVAILRQRPKSIIRNICTESVARYLKADARHNISHALELYAWERFVEGDAEQAATRAEEIRRTLPRHHARGEATDCAELLEWMEQLPDDYLCD